MTTQYNIVSYGTLTNTNGVLSDFSVSNYATLPKKFAPSGDSFEIVIKFKLNSIDTSQDTYPTLLASSNTSTAWDGYNFQVLEGALYFELVQNDEAVVKVHDNTKVLSANVDYYAKATFDGSAYTTYISTNGTTWTQQATVTSSVYYQPTNINTTYLGRQNDADITNVLNGSIDLNESYININDVRWWQGATTIPSSVQTRIQLRHDTSTNWITVNPILGEGEVGIDTNNNYVKIGDGVTAWNSLPYATVPPEVLQVALDDKVDYFEVDSPLTDTWQVGSEAELSTNASVSDSGILSDADYYEYWALQNTTADDYIDNQMSYWKIHFKFKTSNNNEAQPFFGLADGAGEYDTNFIELYVTSGYLRTSNETTNIPIPTNTWIEVDIEHIEGASNVSATINVEGTISTVSNVLNNNYTLSLAKGLEWLGLGVTPFEYDITWNGFHVQNAPYSAKYCLLTNRHIGVDNEAFDGQWKTFFQDIIPTAVSVNGNTDLPYTVTVPNDGHVYEYIIQADGNTDTTSGNFFIAMVKSNVITNLIWLCGNRTRTSSTVGAQGSAIVPIKYGTNNLYLHRSTNYGGTVRLQAVARRRLGTNS